MKKSFILLILISSYCINSFAGNGDSIFNMTYVHNLYITFPYPNFYDSLINTNVTDVYLKVNILFNNEAFNDVGIKVKGNSSFNNPSQKKSFKLDFNEYVQGQDIHGLKKLNFNNSFKDPSFMREKLANDFLIDHGIPAPRSTYCNVYMNNQLWGIYTIIEEIDDEFCNHWFGSNDGNLFKGDPHGDLRWKGSSTQSLYETEYELKNNSTANDWSDLISLIDVINNTPNANLPSLLDTKMNTALFMKQWAALNMFSSLDSYIGSGHNYYLYHDTVTDKFQWIAWDNNEAFGSFKNSLSTTQLKNLDIYFLNNPTSKPLCNNMLLNSAYKNMYNSAYCELKSDFNNTYFDPKIDSIKNIIQQNVYNDPKKFYSNTMFDSSFNYDLTLSGPGGLVVFGIKNFIATRANSIQTSFASNNVTCWPLNTNNEHIDQTIILYPNPSSGLVHIKSDERIESIEIIDLAGKSLYNTSLIINNNIDLSHLTRGFYMIKINHSHIQKILLD
jgi:spore coat protein H